MPILPELDADRKIWTLEANETFDLAEILELTRTHDWKGAKLFLWDLRSLTKGPDSNVEIQDAAEMMAESMDVWRGGRIAVVVARDLDFGVARMFGAFSERFDLEYEVFRDHDAALEWISA